MRKANALFLVPLLALAATAQGKSLGNSESALQKANPLVNWNVESAKRADFDCDGKPDTVMLGSEKDRAVVGIVWGAPKHEQILTFPVGTATQDGFSSQPKTIEVHPLDCKTEDGLPLPGCKAVPDCKIFSVPDDQSDTFNFYWDSSRGRLAW